MPNNPPNNPTAPAISYEIDCTTGFQSGVAAPFVTTLQGNTTIDSAPAGVKFGFTGTATTTIGGGFVANIYLNGLGTGTSQAQWTEAIGGTDIHSTGRYTLNTPTLSMPDFGGTTVRSDVHWLKGSTTLTGTAGDFTGIKPLDGIASGTAGIPQAATVTAVNGTASSITISLATTAAGSAASVSWGATTVFTTPVNTGPVFTTAGPAGGTAGIGLVSAKQFTLESLITFGGALGDGPSNCLLTGWTGAPTPVPGPPQTGGSSPTGDTIPVLPAGSTTPLISVSPAVRVQPAAYVNLNPAATVPDAPTGVSASAGPINSTYATVSWTAPPDGGSPITSYVITTLQGGVSDGTTWVGPVTSGSVVGLATGVPYVFEVSAVNAVGTGQESSPSNALTLDAPPSITSAASTTFVKGQFGTFNVTATGYPTLMHFTKGGVLPGGVTLTSAGVLSGTPTATGTFTFAITASNGVLPIASQAFTLKVVAIKVTTLTLGTAKRGVPYSLQLTEVGGVAPFTWTNTTPKLPAGLTLSSSGKITGKVLSTVTPGNYSVGVSLHDSASPTRNATKAVLELIVAGAGTPAFTMTCPGVPSVGTLLLVGMVNGAISENSIMPGGSVSITGLSLSVTFPQSILSLTAGDTVGGSIEMSLTSTGATPSSMPATFTLPSTVIANPPPTSQTFIAPGTTGTLTASTSATTVMLATGTTASVTLSVNGSTVGPFACTQPVETLASAPIV